MKKKVSVLLLPFALLLGARACLGNESIPLVAEPERDVYAVSAAVGNFSVDDVGSIERLYEPNVFPAKPTFGFSDRVIRAADVGLGKNEAYSILRCGGLDIFAWNGTYDEEQLVNALAGFLNRKEPLIYVDATKLTKHGGDDSIPLNYYKQERGIQFINKVSWQKLLPTVKDALNGIIIYEDSAASNAAAAFFVYNLATVSGCLPVQKAVYLQNTSAFEGMKVVAYFKKGISELPALNYSTTKILPLTNRKHAMCPSAKLDGSDDARFAVLSMKESFLLTDLAFSKKMFLFNIPVYEYLPTYRYFDRIMRHLEKPGTIWGWVTGAAEAVYSNWGHGLVEGTMTKNGSFHAVMPLAHPDRLPRLNPPPDARPAQNKVYLCFTGESLDASMFFFGATLNAYDNVNRGHVKMNWGIVAAIPEMFPALAEYLASKATPNDFFYAFTSYSYTHFDQMTDEEILLHGQKSEKVWRRFFGYSPVQFFLGSNNALKYPVVVASLPHSSLFFVDSIAAPPSFYPYGYNKYLAPGKVLADRAPAYGWGGNPAFAHGKSGRMNIESTLAYLDKVYEAECRGAKPYFFTFWNFNNPGNVDDYMALSKALDPKRFEVVDFGTMAKYAAQVPRATLDKAMNDRIARRNEIAAATLTPLPQPDESFNYAELFAQREQACATVTRTGQVNRIEIRSGALQQSGDKTAHISTAPFALPKGARYCVITIARYANNFLCYEANLTGPFSLQATEDFVMVPARSRDAASTHSGRLVVALSPELYAYTDKGYPVRMNWDLYGKNDGASIEINSIRFVATLPAVAVPAISRMEK